MTLLSADTVSSHAGDCSLVPSLHLGTIYHLKFEILKLPAGSSDLFLGVQRTNADSISDSLQTPAGPHHGPLRGHQGYGFTGWSGWHQGDKALFTVDLKKEVMYVQIARVGKHSLECLHLRIFEVAFVASIWQRILPRISFSVTMHSTADPVVVKLLAADWF